MTTQESPDALADLGELMRDEQDYGDAGGAADPVARRRRRRGWLIAAAIVLAIVLGCGGYVAWATGAALPDPEGSMSAPRAPEPEPVALTLPADGASALWVTGAEEYLGAEEPGIWASSGSEGARPIASIAKIVTALVVLDAHPLSGDDPGPTLFFDRADHKLYDKYYVMDVTIAPMPIGSSMSLRDALATMLIPSASNYAEAIAEWAFGSQWAYTEAARRWLDENGLGDTAIVDATGVDARNTSTPADLVALGRLAAANPVIAEIAATSEMSVPGAGRIATTNTLLGTAGVTGLKTGNLGESGSNLLYTATVDVGAAEPLSMVGVVLGGSSKDAVNASVTALIESVQSGFRMVSVGTGGTTIGEFTVPWGDSVDVVLGEGASIFVWSDTPITVELETTTPTSWDDGAVVGTVTWTSGPNSVSVPIEIAGTLEEPTDWWRLTHPTLLG